MLQTKSHSGLCFPAVEEESALFSWAMSLKCPPKFFMTVFITRCNFIRHPGQKTLTVKNTQATCVVSREEVPSLIFSLLLAASGTLHLAIVQKDFSTMVIKFLNNFVSRIFTYSFYFDDFSRKQQSSSPLSSCNIVQPVLTFISTLCCMYFVHPGWVKLKVKY